MKPKKRFIPAFFIGLTIFLFTSFNVAEQFLKIRYPDAQKNSFNEERNDLLPSWLMSEKMEIKHYRDKIFYVFPRLGEKVEKNNTLIIQTEIPANHAVILNNGKIIVQHHRKISLYAPDLSLIKEINLDLFPSDFSPSYIIADPEGKFLIVGKPDRRQKTYTLYKVDLLSNNISPLINLDKWHFPGIAPIKRAEKIIKENPEFAADYFSLIYQFEDFEGGFIRDGKLYIWFKPDYGSYKGRLYVISLDNPRIISQINDFNLLTGLSSRNFVYTKTADDDASELDKAVYVNNKGKEKKYNLSFITNNMKYGNNHIFAIRDESLRVINLKSKESKEVLVPKNAEILFATPSGNRAFIYKPGQGTFIMLYDVRTGTLTELLSGEVKGFPHSFTSTYDGESFVFVVENRLMLGYINDLSRPVISVRLPDTVDVRTIEFSVNAYDRAFVSGLKNLELNGKPVSNHSEQSLSLNKGVNRLTFRASDRAGNITTIRKQIFAK